MSISRWVRADSIFARRTAEEPVEIAVGHDIVGAEGEVGHVHSEGAVFFEVDQLLQNHVPILRLAVGRQAHELVLTAS